MSPTKDRLAELKRIQNGDNVVDIENNVETPIGINSVFVKVENIRQNIDTIKSNTIRSNNIYQSNAFKLSKDLQTELDSLFKITTSTAHKINKQLKEFQNELNKIDDKSSAEYRIKYIQYSTLREEFYVALEESTISLELHKNKRKDVLKKCLKLVQEEANEEELEALLDSNKLDVFTGNHLITTEEAKRQLRDIEERHEELLKIEKNLTEVMNLFVTIATLVEQQQELVSRVEFHAETANEFVDKGKREIEKTVQTKKKWTKRKFYIIIALLVIVIIFLLVAFL
ncbi:hypothetical protein RN001_012032 [Aquatica leii]|uniref:t-SNARE coiled-coil homology domain-containing protein n=1 Tax=Aquatica leii TaxID=1421715 RepID=A0AAN7SPB7_9COLE|nr:hypothetical protein RN001_012032 [Aquatica leii]